MEFIQIRRGTKNLQAYFVLVVAALIVHGSLYPWRFEFAHGPANPLKVLLNAWPKPDYFAFQDAAINLAFYFPLGCTVYLLAIRTRTRAAATIISLLSGVTLSTTLELLQAYVPSRVCSIFDVVVNLGGTAAGVLAICHREEEFENLIATLAAWLNRHVKLPAVLLLVCWEGYQLFPFVLQFKPRSWPAEMAYLSHPGSLLAAEIWATTAEWFAAGLLLRSLCGRPWRRWLLGLICFRIAVRPFVLTRLFALDELLGAAIAMLLLAVAPAKMRLRAGLAMLTIAIALRQLGPFRFSDLPAAFGPAGAVFRKAFDYGIVVWMLCEEGVSRLRAGAMVVFTLAVFALARWYLPDEGPDSPAGAAFDPALALLMALLLRLSMGFPRPSPYAGRVREA